MLLPVILCGGRGSRLWPLSRQMVPKPFLRVAGKASLFQDTVRRVVFAADVMPPLVVCNVQHRFAVQDHLEEIGVSASAIILEPEARNTAPAMAAAVLWAREHTADATLLFLPSDHGIADPSAFNQALAQAVQAAASGAVLTFGVVPTHPHTEYGYMQASSPLSDTQALAITRFVEKPPHDRAAEFIREGGWYWNSGMFCFTGATGDAIFKAHAKALYGHVQQAYSKAAVQENRYHLGDDFVQTPSISFDYAVMEKTNHAALIPLDAGWTDMGTWQSLWAYLPKDARGNVSTGDVMKQDVQDCLIYGSKRAIAVASVSGLCIVDTEDALLVADMNQPSAAGVFAELLLAQGRPEALRHPYEQRPWGEFRCVDDDEHFKVKRLRIKPGAKLSLQLHRQRTEHWVVVRGKARVVCGDRTFDLDERDSTHIPVNTVHRLENVGEGWLEIIEVQTGAVCDEEDIVRLQDDYNRIKAE